MRHWRSTAAFGTSKFANKHGKADRQAERRAQAQRAKELAKQRKAEKVKQGDRQP